MLICHKIQPTNRIIIILLFWEFLKLELADGFPQEFEWPQVSSSHQDSTQYSGWP